VHLYIYIYIYIYIYMFIQLIQQPGQRTREQAINSEGLRRLETEVLMWPTMDAVKSTSANSPKTTIDHIEMWDPLHDHHVMWTPLPLPETSPWALTIGLALCVQALMQGTT
jgi:hypothetical protein